MKNKTKKGYIIHATNGDVVIVLGYTLKEAREKFHRNHHGTIKKIKAKKLKK